MCVTIPLSNEIHWTQQNPLDSCVIQWITANSNAFQCFPMDIIEISQEYTFEELQAELDRVREGGMPRSTLYNQLAQLRIVRTLNGTYTQDDLEILKDLNRFLRRCKSFKKFEQTYFSGRTYATN